MGYMTQRFDFLSPVAFGCLLGLAFGLTTLGIFGLIAAIFVGIFVIGFASIQMNKFNEPELSLNPVNLYFANSLPDFLKLGAELPQEVKERETESLRKRLSGFHKPGADA